MKKILSTILLILSISINAQEKYSPTIVILNSQETIIPDELDSITKRFIRKKLSEEAKKQIIMENGDLKLKADKEIEFLEESDITTNITYRLNYSLSYKFFEYFPNLLIYPAKEANQSDVKSLKYISEKHNVNWVVNISKVEFTFKEEQNNAIIRFQLYNQKTNQILLDKNITADDHNPGFEFACKSGTIYCVINNSVSLMSSEIMSIMGKEKKYWR